MYKSIPGLDQAFASVQAVESTPRRKRSSAKLNKLSIKAATSTGTEEEKRIQDAKLHDLREANKFYAEFGRSTNKIAAKLREMDGIGLSDNIITDGEVDAAQSAASPPNTTTLTTDKVAFIPVEDEMSNQRRFMKDQVTRAQALLPMEYYLRQLHATETAKQIEDVDERIAFHAKQWKHIAAAFGEMENDPVDEEDQIRKEKEQLEKVMKEKQARKEATTSPGGSQQLHSSGLSTDYADIIRDSSREETERVDAELVEPFQPPVKVLDVSDHEFLEKHPMIVAGE